ncbi:sigma-70 family RNA polymerase sigma factor [Rhodobacter sp. KR11]|uniref:sigma-70 family RNA polymerase sigma factor n=1 Tax=Rhodobacter sp. KR11 TaxID=2974588 RepID=UPI0022214776|nr:sigma-70 family RNA polymerase sigma factor [Rhodobacter sp. KR11]MCW1918033.1 sigma-70 family RNA polymerase sigma factor [Rhodobacter sp. KR11]
MSLLKTSETIRRGAGATIHIAPLLDDEERARRLVATPAMIDLRDVSGRTALHRAAQKGKSQVCRILLEGGANAGIRDAGGLDAAALARLSGHPQLAKVIAEHLAQVEAQKPRSEMVPPLTSAEIARVLTVPTKTVETLIATGRRDALDARGNTLLHIVAKRGALLACEKLFAAGIATDTANKDGKTAADVAEAAGQVAIAEMLRGKALRFDRPEPPKPQVIDLPPLEDFDFSFGVVDSDDAETFHTQGGFGEARPVFDWQIGRVVIQGEDAAPVPDLDLGDLGTFEISGEGIVPQPRVQALRLLDDPSQPEHRTAPAPSHHVAQPAAYLEVRTSGRRSRKTSRPSELVPVSLEEADCRAWLGEVIARGQASPELILDLIDLCQGGWDDDLAANVSRFLEDCGFEAENGSFDPLADLDIDEMTDGLMALCNRTPVLVGRQAFALSAHEERRLLAEIRRCTAAAEAAIAADDVSRSAIISLGRGLLAGAIEAFEVTRIEFREADPGAVETFRNHLDDLEILHDDIAAGVVPDTWTQDRMAKAIGSLELLPEIVEGLAEAISSVDRAKALPVVQAVRAQRDAIHAFLGLHLPWVRLQASREAQEGEEVEDVFQNAWMGLRRALVRFDAARGIRFMVYSAFWMRQHITRARRDESALVRIPVHRQEQLALLDAVREELELKGYPVTLQALSSRTGFNGDLLHILNRSLRKPEEPGQDAQDFACDELGYETVLAQERNLIVSRAMDQLDPRWLAILKGRCGFDDQDEMTLEELGQSMGVTRERIRQIEAKAMDCLAQPSRLGKIRKYL